MIKKRLYFLIPFLAFGFASDWKFNLICKKFQKGDLMLIPVVMIGTYIYCQLFGIIVFSIGTTPTPNAVFSSHSLFYWMLFPLQIFGEELIKVIVILIALFLLYKITENRKISIVIATLITALFFGFIHLPTYNSLISVLFIQGLGCILMIHAYVKTKNIFLSFVIHLLYDIGTILMA